MLAKAEVDAENEVKALLAEAEKSAEAASRKILAEVEGEGAKLEALAQGRMDKAATVIAERVVNG